MSIYHKKTNLVLVEYVKGFLWEVGWGGVGVCCGVYYGYVGSGYRRIGSFGSI